MLLLLVYSVILVTNIYHTQHIFARKSMKNLKNKIALITGGNSGIGFETAKAFVAQGVTTIITGRRKEAIIEAADTIGAIPLVVDQSLLSDIERLAAEVKERYGKLEILFINA